MFSGLIFLIDWTPRVLWSTVPFIKETLTGRFWVPIFSSRYVWSRAGEPEPEPEPVGAGCFWLLGAGAAWEKNQEPEPEPEPLEKKVKSRSRSRSRSRKKICRLPSPGLVNLENMDSAKQMPPRLLRGTYGPL